jgi:hypothetical protein
MFPCKFINFFPYCYVRFSRRLLQICFSLNMNMPPFSLPFHFFQFVSNFDAKFGENGKIKRRFKIKCKNRWTATMPLGHIVKMNGGLATKVAYNFLFFIDNGRGNYQGIKGKKGTKTTRSSARVKGEFCIEKKRWRNYKFAYS